MRVIDVVTLFMPGGTFGGPTTIQQMPSKSAIATPTSDIEVLFLARLHSRKRLPPTIAEFGAGIVVDDILESLITAIDDHVTDVTARQRAAVFARKTADDQFSMTAVVDQLELSYRPIRENVHSGGRTTKAPTL